MKLLVMVLNLLLHLSLIEEEEIMTNKNNMPSMDNFGINLWNLRREKGLTVEKFAELIDKSPRLIYDYESGLKYPSLDTLILIATVLSVSTDSILRAA